MSGTSAIGARDRPGQETARSASRALPDRFSGWRGGFDNLLRKVLAGERVADKELRIQTDAAGFPPSWSAARRGWTRRETWPVRIFIGQDITASVAGERRIKEQARALVEVQEIERLRISRDLHDDVAQDLSAARIACETLFDGLRETTRLLRPAWRASPRPSPPRSRRYAHRV